MLILLLKLVNNYFCIVALKDLRIGSACIRKYCGDMISSMDEYIA